MLEKGYRDNKWRKAIRPSVLAMISLFVMLMLLFCNIAVNNLHIGGQRIKEDSSKRTSPCFPVVKSSGTSILPSGIVQATSDLRLRHLWKATDGAENPQNLLAVAVGIKQKHNVDQIIQKFPADNFTIMLFHYDGIVDQWMDLAWCTQAIHIMVVNQTKWWFGKRFLHPDIVANYNYVFLWDEDLGVEHFHANRYLKIMEEEGLEISQPALHPHSEIHHRLTIRKPGAKVHRRIYTSAGRYKCTEDDDVPPCTGWVEMMAPVFSREAWRCTWLMIQNDLVHGWGIDFKLGYCAQGNRSEKVGIIDEEYILHQGVPTLGGVSHAKGPAEAALDERQEIRKKANDELTVFGRRWRRAASGDPSWNDPYPQLKVGSEFSSVKRQTASAPKLLLVGGKGRTRRSRKQQKGQAS